MSKGFTLVELLIVIALIAILSVAVLATINPIEQTNKARDTKMQNDAAEVLGAVERYYASQNAYPWNLVGQTVTSNVDFVATGLNPGFGILAPAAPGSSTPDFSQGKYGELISTSELKGSFAGKAPFQSSVLPEDNFYLYHSGSTGSNYVCYLPKALANRSSAKVANLKCLDATAAKLYDYVAGATDCGTTMTSAWSYTPDKQNPNLVCVPDGKIN
jgi:prepilin-type N-terminal cleavage/methylation domain-containing protein